MGLQVISANTCKSKCDFSGPSLSARKNLYRIDDKTANIINLAMGGDGTTYLPGQGRANVDKADPHYVSVNALY